MGCMDVIDVCFDMIKIHALVLLSWFPICIFDFY